MAESARRRAAFGEPFFLQWNITTLCNLECSHCYQEQPRDELGLDSLLRVLEGYCALLREMGRDGRVMLSGGEPMLSPHVFEIARECRSRKIPVRILSNGTTIDRATADRLADVGVRAVQVSIEGDRRTHDRIRGAGSYDAAVEGMKALREAGIKVTMALTLTSENRRALPSVARTARTYADRFHVARHVPIGRGAALDAVPLTAAEVHQALVWLDGRRQAWRSAGLRIPLRDPLWKALLASGPGCEECIGGCSIGYNGLCVEADGTVYPCRRLPLALGNALESPLIELWQHPALEKLRDRDLLEGRCGRCDLRWACGGCRAVAESILGHPLAEDPQCFRTVD